MPASYPQSDTNIARQPCLLPKENRWGNREPRHIVTNAIFLAARVLWIPGHATPNTDTISPFPAHGCSQDETQIDQKQILRSEKTWTFVRDAPLSAYIKIPDGTQV